MRTLNLEQFRERTEDNTTTHIMDIIENTMFYAIHIDKITDKQLIKLTRYLFSDKFPQDFIDQENNLCTDEEKQQAFEDLYRRSITVLEPHRTREETLEEYRQERLLRKRDEL